MIEKSLKSIEYDKILNMLADRCAFEESRKRALALRPSPDPAFVGEELAKADILTSYVFKYSLPSLYSAGGSLDAVGRSRKGATLSCRELLRVCGMYRNFDRVKKWFFAHDRNSDLLDWDVSSITVNSAAEKAISDAIISEERVADTASDALYSVRRKIKQTENAVREKLDSLVRSPSMAKYLQDRVVTMRQNRFVLPVKAEYRREVNGVIHDVSASGSTYFVEPDEVARLEAQLLQLANIEQEEVHKVLAGLSDMVARGARSFEDSYEKLMSFDLYLAKARLAVEMDAVCPSVEKKLRFRLNRARHPLIDKAKVVPIDISLGYGRDTMIITGPNTGGKTVSLKTAGLLCAMAASGLLIPAAESSSVCVYDKILADIGDEQSIEQSLSTFSGHIKNISGILRSAGPESLVLMDELGSGTDPAEGAALALAIIEKLREKGAQIIATTHYGELKIYALGTPGVLNAGCEFDLATLRPTYRIITGVPGRSNAFYISRRLGIGEDVIDRAREHLSEDEKNLNAVYSQLEDMRKQLKESREEMDRLRNFAADANRLAEEKSRDMINRARLEAETITRAARQKANRVQEEAYRLSDELKKLRRSEKVSAAKRLEQARRIARDRTARLISSVGEENTEAEDHPVMDKVARGDRVIVASLGRPATVQSEADSKGMVEVLAGVIKTKVHISDLYPDTSKKTRKPKYRPVPGAERRQADGRRDSNTEINLLGMTVDDAVLEVDRFIDNGVMKKLRYLYLIHGKGTGALRAGIHKYLKTNPHVRSFRLGTFGEGESGVTVVELK